MHVVAATTTTTMIACTKGAIVNTITSNTLPVMRKKDEEVKGQPKGDESKGGPQCCHCGWRGDHDPNCPFA
ncbi:hypothetical protein EUX98_g6322 [Antrodiella citrinella]|uniref:Uncharacterized protein n=1 Tax=Antrodiella citrinella TaxID=2447956 RepID=A0A4S4MQ47_9APHY|nr:hypothetical protein EUX98_g6322 [Antrodiella citrinella]